MTYETLAAWGGTISTIIMMVVFFGALIFIFRPGSKKTYEKLARVPLEDDDNIGERKDG